MMADAYFDHYYKFAETHLKIFHPHIPIQAQSVAHWLYWGDKEKFVQICRNAAALFPQVHEVRWSLKLNLNNWIHECRKPFDAQCVLEQSKCNQRFVLASMPRQSRNTAAREVMGIPSLRDYILQLLKPCK